MTNHDIEAFSIFATSLADIAAEIATKYYRGALLGIINKSDGSLVTKTDVEVEQALFAKIKASFPTHGIIGEESGSYNGTSEYKWVIDPIDGTSSFAIGRPTFTTLIALLHKNKPILSVMSQPITKDRWIAKIDGDCYKVTLNGKAISVSNETDISKALLATTGPNYFNEAKLAKFNRITTKVSQVVYGGDCYNYGLLALGTIDAIVESGLKLHDYAPLIPIVKAAGGVITNWQGNDVVMGEAEDIVAASSPSLHQKLLEILN